MESKKQIQKSPSALREESILAYWEKENIFEKSLQKESPQGDFVFFGHSIESNAQSF